MKTVSDDNKRKNLQVMLIRRGESQRYCVDFSRLEIKCLELMNNRCVDKYVTVISQLSVFVSHKLNLGICRPGTWELSLPQFGSCNF